MVEELSFKDARTKLPEGFITCQSSKELEPLSQIIGQERAVKALQFGLEIREKGFNIYAAGPRGTGKKTAIEGFLKEIAKTRPTPADWCYVNNFDDPLKPNAIMLPAGTGKEFRKNMDAFAQSVAGALIQSFESDEYSQRREEVIRSIQEKQQEISEKLTKMAKEAGFVLRRTPVGIVLIPTIDGKPARAEDLEDLSPDTRKRIQQKRQDLQHEFHDTMREFRNLEKEAQSAVKDLNREVADYALEPLFSELIEKYGDIDEIKKFLKDVKGDILDSLRIILGEEQQETSKLPPLLSQMRQNPTDRYKVNLIVDNSNLKGAPVITEMNPTFQRLIGRIEKEARFGALVTDYSMIRCGSLHSANGGFLIIPTGELLTKPFAWEGLKRAIMNEKIEIEEIAERLGYLSTKSLQPEPIPLDVKIILAGELTFYHMLYTLDKDFKEIFKVKAEFDTSMDRNNENLRKYASFICALCEKENIIHLDASGIAAIIEHSSRMAADKEKLSTMFAEIADIIREANFYAREEGANYISKKHVDRVLEEQVYRSNLIQKKIEEMITRGTLLIDIEGEKVGQVNGLSVLDLGDYQFGRPTRVTASIGVGKEGIIDIEREAQMGGPIHTKGVQILSGYLHDKYAEDKPLSLTARLVFEQTYSGVEGDSASSTELYALLSVLSNRPVKQYLAVTGSVNQKGQVQAIGGVNEKIEGYYELCRTEGLNGKQGVVIPESNVKNLMLKEEVVEAIRKDSFHIYPVKTIKEGIEVLTGIKAGDKRPDGTYPEDTINYKVQIRLTEMAESARKYKVL
ncbi:AAA family ATPase [Candidatus Bathyarchaeota archaeon]|nr:AAA family ATPase [Candidatus Bathyarchaeota archaeon]